MSDVIIYDRIQLRRGTASALATVNEVLRQGEPCQETDTGRFKIGDGATAYNSLPYANVNFSGDTPADGDALVWNETLGLWVPSPVSGGGDSASTVFHAIWDFADHGFSTSVATGSSFVTNNTLPTVYLYGGTATLQSSEAGHPGIVRLSTSTSSSNYARMFYTPGLRVSLAGGAQRFTQVIRIPTLSTSGERLTVRAGLANIINGGGGQYVAMEYSDNINSGNWSCFAIDGSGTTTTNSAVAPTANTWTKVEVEVNAAGTSAEFFVDNVSIATVAANIPAGDLGFCVWLTKNVGNAARNLDIDVAEMRYDFTSAR